MTHGHGTDTAVAQTGTPTGTSTVADAIGVEIGEGVRAILREPAAIFFSIVMPVAFFALFVGLFGDAPTESGLPVGLEMLARFGAFGVISVMMMNPGIQVADDRTRGWLRMKKISATPGWVAVVGKVISALPYAFGIVVVLSVVAMLVTGTMVDPVTWLRLVLVLVLGSLPFALLSLAIGFVASAAATTAILNAIMFPMVIASGLWMPLTILPGWIQAIAPFLPSYHLGELATAQLTGAPILGHIAVLLVTVLVTGALATAGYRNLRV